MKKYETKYRVIPNPSFNDFNAELPYTIVAVDYDPRTDLIRQKGFNGWSNHKCDLFSTRQSCECWFVTLINNEFVSTLKRNTVELQRRLDVVEKALELMIDIHCNKSRQDLELILRTFVFKKGVIDFIKEQAEKELKGELK